MEELSARLEGTCLEDKAAGKVAAPTTRVALRPLPMVNLLKSDDKEYIEALLEETLPNDCNRFRRYLSEMPLGVGVITAVSPFIA